MNFQYLSSKFVLALVCGVVVGAVGYKLVNEKKLNPQELTSTIKQIAGKFSNSPEAKGRGQGKGRSNAQARGGRAARRKA